MAKKRAVKKAPKRVKPNPELEKADVVVGRRRATDTITRVRVSNKLARQIKQLAGDNSALEVTEEEFYTALAAQISGNLDQGISVEGVEFAFSEPPPNVLDQAKDIIYGDREQAYGSPRFNLDSIALFWTTYLHRKFHSWGIEGAKLDAEDVAQFMILLKTARLIHNPTHFDSLVDQAGYAALQHRIQDQ